MRHCTTTLSAALNVANGAVPAQCRPRHRRQEFIAFLRHINANVPIRLDVRLTVDDYAAHKHAKVEARLARRPRRHIHYMPMYASWLDQAECWCGIITQKTIRRGSFSGVKELAGTIDAFTARSNRQTQPFVRVAAADSILGRTERSRSVLSGTGRQEPAQSIDAAKPLLAGFLCLAGRKKFSEAGIYRGALLHSAARVSIHPYGVLRLSAKGGVDSGHTFPSILN